MTRYISRLDDGEKEIANYIEERIRDGLKGFIGHSLTDSYLQLIKKTVDNILFGCEQTFHVKLGFKFEVVLDPDDPSHVIIRPVDKPTDKEFVIYG